MPLTISASTSLKFIDEKPSDHARQAAHGLIQQEIPVENTTTPHPALPPLPDTKFSVVVEQEFQRLAADEPKKPGIDLTRYEALDAPAKGQLESWRSTLSQAYVSAEYLRARGVNLGLLETFGKNAWLVGNSHLEDLLRPLEKEVEEAKLEAEKLEQARQAAQHNAAGELDGLEQGWRKGVGRMIETQAAAEKLRLEILERRRAAAK